MSFIQKSFMPGIAICLAFLAYSCATPEKSGSEEATDYTAYVDPYIGSGEHGHVFVGANVPFGAVQVGPQNIFKGWDWCSGYHYSDSIIIGFSHTHLSGTGCSDLGDILLMPYTGEVRTLRGEQDNIKGAASSYYSHANESVEPGYYSLLMDNGVKAELTATERVALHRYTYPAEGERRLLINLKEGIGDVAYDTYLKKVDEYTVEGYRFSKGWSPRHKVFFTLKSEQPIASLAVFNDDQPAGNDELKGESVKGVITFKSDAPTVLVKVAISSVSCENALANLQAELADWNFDGVRNEATRKWNEQLACIDIDTPDERAKKIFYTAMYHMFIAPTLYCDVNGDFRGHDDKVYTNNTWKNYSTFSLWDTYRTLHPLFTIIKPQYVPDLVNSMLSIYDQQEKLPIWPLIGGETNQMPGYSAVPVIADAYLKGITGFDAERAYQAMVASSVYEKQNGVPYVLEKRYIPCDKVREATSIAMEYAADDWGIALMAKKMGKTDDYQTYLKRGKYYAQYFDKSINFIRPKMNDGSWRTPYDPFRSVHSVGDFCEGNGWHYTFFVPQHPEGLIALMGGDAPFIAKLDSLFTEPWRNYEVHNLTGFIGNYCHGNQPDHSVPYTYYFIGKQEKSQAVLDSIMNHYYDMGKEHLAYAGMDDAGEMSAWYVFNAMGIYTYSPADPEYIVSVPLFDKVHFTLDPQTTFTITRQGTGRKIKDITYDGQKIDGWFVSHDLLRQGKELIITTE